VKWYLKVLRNYAVFSGRARRKEYWIFVLFNIIFSLVSVMLDNIVGTTIEGLTIGLFYFLYHIAVLIPGFAVTVRRLHDVGKSGWMILISLIPLIGAFWLLVILITDSENSENQYGPNPKKSHLGDSVKGDTPLSSTGYDKSKGDILILIVVTWMLFNRLFWIVLPNLTLHLSIFMIITEVIGSFVPICLAFAVKDKSKRIVLFVLGGIYLLCVLYRILHIQIFFIVP